ncbi:MAG TPA: pirin family protein [Pirellulales bacterium]|nr:pirin family protein [Pirellulales bacterium]
MFQVRRANERGHFDHGWLNTFHTFSFGDYYDPAHTQFRALRVMNEDTVAPGQGFGMHGHRDMEIVTYVLSGALEHRDSLGNGEVLRPGELQRMAAGTGIRHSEFNPSATELVHLYQIWLLPERTGLTPGYEQKSFADAMRPGQWLLVASPDAADGSLHIRQDARLYLAQLEAGQQLSREIPAGRHAWLQVLRGGVNVGGASLAAGDGVAVSNERQISLASQGASEVLLFDLA